MCRFFCREKIYQFTIIILLKISFEVLIPFKTFKLKVNMVVSRITLSHIYKCIQLRSGINPLSTSLRSNGLSVVGVGPSRSLCQASDDNSNKGLKGDGDKLDKDSKEKSVAGKKIRKQPKDAAKAKARLNDLLQSIVKEQDANAKLKKETKAVAIEFKLAKPMKPKSPLPTEEELKAAAEQKETEKSLGKEMLQAVKTVASSVKGDAKEVESELVQKLKTQRTGKISFSDLVSGMKVDKEQKQKPPVQEAPTSSMDDRRDPNLSRAHQVRQILDQQRQFPRRGGGRDRDGRGDRGDRDSRDEFSDGRRTPYGRQQQRGTAESQAPINLFGSRPLSIFSQETANTPKKSYLKTWDLLQEKELKLAVLHPPANGFEEMILWTEKGKLWHYPINNEQALDEEAKVSFTEHVFLEPNMDSWCPKRGPIRHFMELVCVGLSKNPYLSVEEKKDQIEWYHEYFKGKATLIQEVGAGDIK